MGNYLDELVKKGDTVEGTEVAVEPKVEEVVKTAEEAASEEIVVEAEEANESYKEEVEETSNAVAEENSTAEEIEDTNPEENKVTVDAVDVADYCVGQHIFATKIRVYNTPSLRQVAKIISGNVIFQDRIDGFAIIQYMRPGFGLVTGYTPDI